MGSLSQTGFGMLSISRSWDNQGQNKIVIRLGHSPGRGTQGCQVVGSAVEKDEPREENRKGGCGLGCSFTESCQQRTHP